MGGELQPGCLADRLLHNNMNLIYEFQCWKTLFLYSSKSPFGNLCWDKDTSEPVNPDTQVSGGKLEKG